MAYTHRLLLLVLTAFSLAACGGGGSASPTSPTPTTSTPPPASAPVTVAMTVSVSRPTAAAAADVRREEPAFNTAIAVAVLIVANNGNATVGGSCIATNGLTLGAGANLNISPSGPIAPGSPFSTTFIVPILSLFPAPNELGTIDCRITGTTSTGTSLSENQTVTVPSTALRPTTTTCTPGVDTLCALGGRFKIQATATHSSGQTSPGQVPSSSDRFNDGGFLWFFGDRNTELLVQILNRCSSGSYWVFAAGLTSMEIAINVTDTQSGVSRRYVNPQGQQFRPVQDTNAFATCP